MKIPFLYLTASTVFALSLSSCDKKSDPTEEKPAAEKATAEPTRGTAIALLTDFAQKLESNDHDAATKMLRVPSGIAPDQIKKAVGQFLSRREISSAGVKILAEKGKWGKLTDVLPERGKRFAEKAGVDADSCWALSHENAEAAFLWEDGQFYIIRCDDIGKLGTASAIEPEKAAPTILKPLSPQKKLEKKPTTRRRISNPPARSSLE